MNLALAWRALQEEIGGAKTGGGWEREGDKRAGCERGSHGGQGWGAPVPGRPGDPHEWTRVSQWDARRGHLSPSEARWPQLRPLELVVDQRAVKMRLTAGPGSRHPHVTSFAQAGGPASGKRGWEAREDEPAGGRF